MDYEFLTALRSVFPFLPVLSMIMQQFLQNTGEHCNKWGNWWEMGLTFSWKTLKNGQSYFKNLAVFFKRKIFKVCLAIFEHYEWKGQ